MKEACCLHWILLALLLGFMSNQHAACAMEPGREGMPPAQTAANAGACSEEAERGVFRPECFQAAGSGNLLVSAWDAAFNAAAHFVTDRQLNPSGTGATVVWSGQYQICNAQQGFVLPQSPVLSGGAGVSLAGDGPGAQLSLICTIQRSVPPPGMMPGSPLSNAAFWMPVPSEPHYTQYNWHDFTLYANGRSSGCIDMEGLIHVSNFSNLILSGAAGDGSATSNCLRWGNSRFQQATANQVELRNIGVTAGGTSQGSGFEAVSTVRDGLPFAVLKHSGEGYSQSVLLYLAGPPARMDAATGLTSPCKTMGDLRRSVEGGKITAVTMQGFSGCEVGTVLKAFDPVFPVNFAVWFDAFTDSPYLQLNPQTGQTAGVLAGPATGNNVYQGVHICCGMPTGFIEQGHGDSFLNFYADGVGQRALAFGAGASATVQQSKLYWNAEAGAASSQAGAYAFGEGVGTITISGGVCNSTGMQIFGGYHHVVSSRGADQYPATLNVFADEDCSDHHLITFLSTPFINTLQAALNQKLVLKGSAPRAPTGLTVEPSGEVMIGDASQSRLSFAMKSPGSEGCEGSINTGGGALHINQPCERGRIVLHGNVFTDSLGSATKGTSDLNGLLLLRIGSSTSSTYHFSHPHLSTPICWVAPAGLTPDQLQSLNGVVPVVTTTDLYFEVGTAPVVDLHLGYACLGRD